MVFLVDRCRNIEGEGQWYVKPSFISRSLDEKRRRGNQSSKGRRLDRL